MSFSKSFSKFQESFGKPIAVVRTTTNDSSNDSQPLLTTFGGNWTSKILAASAESTNFQKKSSNNFQRKCEQTFIKMSSKVYIGSLSLSKCLSVNFNDTLGNFLRKFEQFTVGYVLQNFILQHFDQISI